MNKKKFMITLALLFGLCAGIILYVLMASSEFKPASDEIALHIQLDTKEDVGLLVFDYCIDDLEYSGGISNADKSLIKHHSDNIQVWNKQELNCSSDNVELSIRFRIITEYRDPNFENVYPDNITKYTETISWEATFGNSYYVTITGDRVNGYSVVLN